ncbi:MAG: hypothetical protein IT364_03270, partial [Candidatus Hydrogenedentes bacterium]|nr:hypothetical protein [Candidatus Hydrogenedentota bacterium]
MRSRVLTASLVAFLLSPTYSGACGPFFPVAYLAYGEEVNILQMPQPYFSVELALSLGQPRPNPPAWPRDVKSSRERTLEADIADLNAALAKRGDSAERIEELAKRYLELRTAMDKQCALPRVVPPPPNPYAVSSEPAGDTAPQQPNTVASFDLTPLNALLNELPAEFELYVRGAHAYRTGDKAKAVALWESLLALPTKERHYRSTWAAYMLAKALHDSDPEQSLANFKQVVELTEAGFSDSLSLVPDSQNW